MGIPGADLADIATVYSHPQGLMQTGPFLEEHGWKQVSLANTAVSARKVKDDNDITQAAVASVRAAEIYGLEVLQEDINTQSNNTTRFVIVSKRKMFTHDADVISISFSLRHESGTLYNALGHFIFNGLNMTSIESEPLPDTSFEYRFFITFDGNLKEQAVQNALSGIQSETTGLKILGNYKIS